MYPIFFKGFYKSQVVSQISEPSTVCSVSRWQFTLKCPAPTLLIGGVFSIVRVVKSKASNSISMAVPDRRVPEVHLHLHHHHHHHHNNNNNKKNTKKNIIIIIIIIITSHWLSSQVHSDSFFSAQLIVRVLAQYRSEHAAQRVSAHEPEIKESAHETMIPGLPQVGQRPTRHGSV